jgi:hypothetical protein
MGASGWFSVALTVVLLISHCLAAPPPPPTEARFVASPAPVRRTLVGVVQAQLVAFRKGDFEKAYSYASAEIRRRFDRAQFARMVRESYPAIANSQAARFGGVFDDGRRAVVHAEIDSTVRRQVMFAYLLVREAGQWKISGVYEAETPSLDGEIQT